MGNGAAVAQQSADMVLTDGDFLDAIKAVMYGRNIYTNIKRFLMFQITCNFTVLLTVFIGYCYLTESPITATQLLWINLIIDTFAALALATMPPMTTVLDEAPAKSDIDILSKIVWRQIYGLTLWSVIVMIILIFLGKEMFHLTYTQATQTTTRVDGKLTAEAIAKKTHFTVIFNTFVQLAWFNEWNCRVVGPREFNVFKNFFSSWTYLFVMIGVAVMQWSSCNWLSWLFET
jgi:magnesium-transporting ATPase (P-type)